jgi:hypothetical protein
MMCFTVACLRGILIAEFPPAEMILYDSGRTLDGMTCSPFLVNS